MGSANESLMHMCSNWKVGLHSAWIKYYNGEPSNNIDTFKNFQAPDFTYKYNKNARDLISPYRRLMDYKIAHCTIAALKILQKVKSNLCKRKHPQDFWPIHQLTSRIIKMEYIVKKCLSCIKIKQCNNRPFKWLFILYNMLL